ncbi:MAG TPA: hypothetical protein VL175_19635, partial [Pirellulales bacterium]|nr:hypothetical protein [Pirellulales bacterium]
MIAAKQILLVDDDEAVGRALAKWLRRWDYDVAVVTSVMGARLMLQDAGHAFVCVVSDYNLLDGNGSEVMTIAEHYGIPCLLYSGAPQDTGLKIIDKTDLKRIAEWCSEQMSWSDMVVAANGDEPAGTVLTPPLSSPSEIPTPADARDISGSAPVVSVTIPSTRDPEQEPDLRALAQQAGLSNATKERLDIADRVNALSDTLLGENGVLYRLEVDFRTISDGFSKHSDHEERQIAELVTITKSIAEAQLVHNERDDREFARHEGRLNRQRVDTDAANAIGQTSNDLAVKAHKRLDEHNKFLHDHAGRLAEHDTVLAALDERVKKLE